MDVDCINKFLRRYSNKNTRAGYRATLNKFFQTIKADPQTYFESGRDYQDDIETFADSLRERPPKTFKAYTGIIRKFYQRNDVELKQYVWDDLRVYVKGKRAITQDRPPTMPELKRILSHCDLRQKALYLTLVSSGMRIGEACSITEKDIDFEYNPTKISIRGEYTKTAEPRICFISDEASAYVEEWLKHKQTYLDYVIRISNLPDIKKSSEDNRIFPFTTNAGRLSLIRILKKTGLDIRDDRTNRYIIHQHVFRKFFRSRMALSCPTDAVEMLMGHEGYLSGAYVRFSESELAGMYKKSMHEVTILEGADFSGELEELKEQMKEKDKELAEIEQRTEFLKNLDKKQLQKLMAVLSGEASDKVWEEWAKRPKKWVKNIPKEEEEGDK